MPRHKQPPRLLTLATSAVADLVEATLPSMAGMTSPARQEAAATVRDTLTDNLLPAMWDPLFHAVLERARHQGTWTNYYASIYAIFVHENVRKLTLRRSIVGDVISDRLKNLVELDASSVDSGPSLCALVGRVCRRLLSVTLNDVTVPDCYVGLAGCSSLKSLTYVSISKQTDAEVEFTQSAECRAATLALDLFPILEHYSYSRMGEVLYHLRPTRTLSLRSVVQDSCTVAVVERIIASCPHLRRLDSYDWDTNIADGAPVLEALATSSLRVRELTVTVTHFDQHFRHFVEKKGTHLVSLTLGCSQIPDHAARLIARCCSNLIQLTLHSPLMELRTPNPANTSIREKICPSSLTKLTHFSYTSEIPRASHIELFKIILPADSVLSSLDVAVCDVNIDEFLKELMSLEINNLEDLSVRASASTVLTVSVFREVYSRFPRLSFLVLNCADERVRRCLKEIRREVEDGNLDLYVSVF